MKRIIFLCIFLLTAGLSSFSVSAASPQSFASTEKATPIPVTRQEIEMMEYVVEMEVGGLSLTDKRIIADVIVNRVLSPEFPNTVAEVLTQKYQFPTIQNYYDRSRPPSRETKQAVRELLFGQYRGIAKGAKYFYAPRWADKTSAAWFESALSFLFERNGQRFFC